MIIMNDPKSVFCIIVCKTENRENIYNSNTSDRPISASNTANQYASQTLLFSLNVSLMTFTAAPIN